MRVLQSLFMKGLKTQLEKTGLETEIIVTVSSGSW